MSVVSARRVAGTCVQSFLSATSRSTRLYTPVSIQPSVTRTQQWQSPRMVRCLQFRHMRMYSTTRPLRYDLNSHDAAVQDISNTIKGYHARGEKYRISHGSTNSTRTAAKQGNRVNLSQLNHVIKVDTSTKTALVEPNVPMDRLVEATMVHGLLPPVVMDFPGITVGGGYAGTSGESSSFRHGFFDRTMNWVEMVQPDGNVVRISDTNLPDLLHSAAGAVGSMGTTTLVELRLIESKDYIETTYHRVTSMDEAVSLTQTLIKNPTIDYVDGIMYSATLGAIVSGKLTNTPSPTSPVQRFSSPSDPWYYMHVHSRLTSTSAPTVTEALPTAEYLFRYDRGGFWVGRLAFQYFLFPFNALTRWFLDDFLHTRMMYTALHAGGAGREIIIQDLALPYSTASEFVKWTDANTGIWPLWLCPLKTPRDKSFHPTTTEGEGMLNIGLWGWCPPSTSKGDAYEHYVAVNKALETQLHKLGGKKWLYAQTFYDESSFWNHYGGRGWYDKLREKYNATGLPSVFEKVRTDVEAEKAKRAAEKTGSWAERIKTVWPFGGFYGIRQAIKSRDYVAARGAKWRTFRPEDKKKTS